MNKLYFLAILFCFHNVCAQRHELTLDHLLSSSTMPPVTFTAYVKQKGFKTIQENSFTTDLVFSRTNKDKSVRQLIHRWENPDTIFTTFQTTIKQEALNWQQELAQRNFLPFNEKASPGQKNIAAFQKGNIIARIRELPDSTATRYCLELESKKLPPATAIQYAEDLLQLNTHEYIAAVFGSHNVKKDQFYFSENERNSCSILFPNTSNQVIFIWNDEENSKDISFLILGGLANNSSQAAIFNGNQFHKWRSRQGIYLGMTLRDLQLLNGKPIEFYAWNSDQPGFVLTKNNGHINLKNLGIQLQCLECFEDGPKASRAILTSETVLNENDRVRVNSLIILPDKSHHLVR